MEGRIRIKKLFNDLYDGSPWIDVTLTDTLKSITAEQASRKVSPQWNTIWEIVNHLISWRETVLGRVQGKIIASPEHNYFTPITDGSEAAWHNTLDRLAGTQASWNQFLTDVDESAFDNLYQANNNTFYEHIHGIIQHDAYHLGQIVLLAKAV